MKEYIEQILININLELQPMIENILLCKPNCSSCGGEKDKGVCIYCGEKDSELETYINNINTKLNYLIEILNKIEDENIEMNLLFNNLLKIKKYNIELVNNILDKYNYKNKIIFILDKINQNKSLDDIEINYLKCLIENNELETNKMLIDICVIGIFKSQINVDFESFKQLFTNHISELLKGKSNLSHCKFKENLTADDEKMNGCVINNIVFLNEKLLKEFYEGKNFKLIQTIFHELQHINQGKLIKSGNVNLSIINLIKEKILRENLPNYYDENYSIILSEVDAEYYGLQNMLNYFEQLGIKLNSKTKQIFEEEIQTNLSKMNIKKRTINGKETTIDSLFNEYIKDKPELLNKYKQLEYLYKIEKNEVVQKTFDDKMNDFNSLMIDSNDRELLRNVYKELLLIEIEENVNENIKK